MLNDPTERTTAPAGIFGKNVSICHTCPRRQKECAGACACLEDGRDIIKHAEAGDCPLGHHVRAPAAGLGDVAADVAKRLGAEWAAAVWSGITGRDCGCDKRRRQLNRLVPFGRPPVDR
jgi:hypothetical protein